MKTVEEIKDLLDFSIGELEFKQKKFIEEANKRMPSIVKLTEINSKCDKLESRINTLQEVLSL